MTDENGTVRVDTGIVEGSELSMFYDPMIAKLITWADTREAAIDRQLDALDNYELKGLGHNIEFLAAVMPSPRFRSVEITTGFLAEGYHDGFHGVPANTELNRRLTAGGATRPTSHAPG